MKQWEYLTKFVEANANTAESQMYADVYTEDNPPMYTPEAMMPELNHLGAKGWELVHMQPVMIGKNHDVLVHEGGGSRRWSNTYFCVFKRPLS